MKHFEFSDKEKFADANGKLLECPPMPDDDFLKSLMLERVTEAFSEDVNQISNVVNEIGEEDEGWRFSEIPAQVTRYTIEKIMMELTGASWLFEEKEDGYSAGETIEILSEKAFIQMSELTEANVRACLENGGKIIAYFPDLVWREYYNQLSSLPEEILGMRTVEIKEIKDDFMVINDYSSEQGKDKHLDKATFLWLSRDGWMLEVYK